MFYKQLENGNYRYFEKFFDEKTETWKQVTVTLKSKTRVSQAEAKKRLARKIDKIHRQPTKQEAKTQLVENKTVQAVYDEWKIIRKENTKPASYDSEQISLRGFIFEFSDEKIADITTFDVQTYLMGLQIANSTRKNRKIYLRLFFRYAESIGYIENNPVDKVIIPRVKLEVETLERVKSKFLTKEEMKSVLEFCRTHNKDERYTLAMEFIFLTGCRFGEFASIRYQDIDFKSKFLKIDHSLEYRVSKYDDRVLQTPKTVGSVRTISLSDRCLEIIAYFKKHCLDQTFIFVNDKGGLMRQPVLYRFIQNNCRTVLGEERSYSIHMLRHSHITLLAELGIPIKAIMERVGHRDESITLGVYSHVSGTVKDEVSRKLNGISL